MVLELIPKDETGAGEDKNDSVETTPVYKGSERRKEHRRTKADRREMVRFEAKTDRRGGKERRNTLGLWKNRDY